MTRTLGLLYLALSVVGITVVLCLWALAGYRVLRRRVRRWQIARMLWEVGR